MDFQSRKAKARWLLIAAIVGVTWIVFGRAVRFGLVGFDDTDFIRIVNERPRGLGIENIRWACRAVVLASWHPVTCYSFLVDRVVFGMSPGWMHAENILIHCGCSVLLFLMLENSTGKRWQSVAVALLFAIHPTHVESVAWIAERKDVLSILFLFWSWLVYVDYAKSGKVVSYVLMALLYGASLASKSMGVTYPFLLILWDIWPLGRVKIAGGVRAAEFKEVSWRRGLLEKTPLLAMACGASSLTYWAQHVGHSVAPLTDLPMVFRITNLFISYGQYLLMLFVPVNLSIFYPLRLSIYFPGVGAAILLLGVITFAVLKPGKARGYLPIGWFWFLGTLFPTIGLVQVGSQAMADRYLYLPSVGIFIAVVWGIADLSVSRHWFRRVGTVAAIIVYSLATYVQVGYWRNDETLFRHALAIEDDNWLAHDHLGAMYFGRGDYVSAIKEYLRTIELNPNYAQSYSNVGDCVVAINPARALPFYERAIELASMNPAGYEKLASALYRDGQVDRAHEMYLQALRLDSKSTVAIAGERVTRR